jgi:hypothetical protein
MNKNKKNLISDEEFERQLEAARQNKDVKELRAVSISHENGATRIELEDWSFTFNPRRLPELANATEAELADVRLLGVGNTIEWTTLDGHRGVGSIITALLGESYIKSLAARISGSKTSERKAAAVRANGALGGRPKGSIKSQAKAKAGKG